MPLHCHSPKIPDKHTPGSASKLGMIPLWSYLCIQRYISTHSPSPQFHTLTSGFCSYIQEKETDCWQSQIKLAREPHMHCLTFLYSKTYLSPLDQERPSRPRVFQDSCFIGVDPQRDKLWSKALFRIIIIIILTIISTTTILLYHVPITQSSQQLHEVNTESLNNLQSFDNY